MNSTDEIAQMWLNLGPKGIPILAYLQKRGFFVKDGGPIVPESMVDSVIDDITLRFFS